MNKSVDKVPVLRKWLADRDAARGRGTCARCGRVRLFCELNTEGMIHHGTAVECYDRKDCDRARRKARPR